MRAGSRPPECFLQERKQIACGRIWRIVELMSRTSEGGEVCKHGKDSGPSVPTGDVRLEEFREVCEQARAGKPEACEELHRLFSPYVRRTIRRRTHRVLRKLYDTADLLQYVWLAFFLDVLPSRTFQHPRQLVQLLNRLARNEVLNVYRYHVEAQKRDLSREVPLEGEGARSSGNRPTQEEPWRYLAVCDELDWVLHELSEPDRAVLNALRQGDKPEEAAARFGVSVRKVWRILERCRHRHTCPC
jgi:RNA polymerase sigma factor (sigma-70 family)